MAIGPRLREARQRKQLTTSQVAEMTRMKVQIVDDLENDDFHRIAATIYGKGFIKLFAECVDLDPDPLLADYLQQVGSPQPPKLPVPQNPEPLPEALDENATAEDPEPETAPADDLFTYADHSQRRAKRSVTPAAPKPPPPPKQRTISQRHRRWQMGAALPRMWQQVKRLMTRHLENIMQKITQAGAHDQWIQRILLALGLIVLILILIPLLRMLFAPREPLPLPDDALILFVEPPEPYLE